MVRTTRLLNLRRIRRQPLRALIAVVSVASGVAMAVAVMILSTSTTESVRSFAARLSGPTELRVMGATGRGGLDPSVVGKIESTPGVAAAVPVIQAVTFVEAADGHNTPVVALGIDCRIERILGPSNCDPKAIAQWKTTSPPLAPPALVKRMGAGAMVRHNLGRSPLAGGPELPQLNRFNGGNVIVAPMPIAQQWFGRNGRVDVVYVKAAKGVSVAALKTRLQSAVGEWNGVLTASDPPPGAGAVTAAFVPLFGLLASFALGVGAVLIFNTMSLSLEDRRRDLAIVGALGGTRRVVMVGTLLEAALLGIVGGLAGVFAGWVVAHPLASSVSDFTAKFAGVPITVHAGGPSIVTGVVLGMVVAAAAAFVPARRATRMDVSAELSNREARQAAATATGVRRFVVFFAIGLAGMAMCHIAQRGGGLTPWQAALGPLGVLVASIGFLFGTGALARLVIAGVRRADGGRSPGVLRLALANTAREPGRTSVMAVAVGAAVGVAFLVAGSHRSIHDAIAEGVSSGNPREVFVSVVSPNNSFNVEARPSADMLARMAAVPGVAAVDRQATVLTGHDDKHLIAVNAFERPWLNFHAAAGTVDRARFEAGEVVVGPGLARRDGLRPGSYVSLPTPNGFVRLKVQAVVFDGNFAGNIVQVPYSMFERLYGPQVSQGFGLIRDASTSPEELAARVRALRLDRDVQVDTPRQAIERASDDVKAQLRPFDALQRVLLLVAFVAVLSTLLLVGAQRKRELGMLAAVGMDPGQLARMTVLEAGIVGLCGVLLSIVAGVALQIAFNDVVPIVIGFKDPLRFAFDSLLVAGPVALAVVLLAALLPALRTARVEVLSALQYE